MSKHVRQQVISIPDTSALGPFNMCNRTVVVIGLGTLGSSIAAALASCGATVVGIDLENEKVENHNVSSQIYRAEDIGKLKVDAFISICETKQFSAIGVKKKIENTDECKTLLNDYIEEYAVEFVVLAVDNKEGIKDTLNILKDSNVVILKVGFSDIQENGDFMQGLEIIKENFEGFIEHYSNPVPQVVIERPAGCRTPNVAVTAYWFCTMITLIINQCSGDISELKNTSLSNNPINQLWHHGIIQ